MQLAKSLAKRLPAPVQFALKREWRAHQIRRGTFGSKEPEWLKLADWIRPGDTVLDIGANAGHYALRMSALVGPTGRVISFEPIPVTFRELVDNAALAPFANCTLVNAAVSDRTAILRMTVPDRSYRASITDEGQRVLALALDSLNLPHIDLVKIDVEGHEYPALVGMRALLERDWPRLIVEENDPSDTRVREFLTGLGYSSTRAERSPNAVYVR